MKRIKSVIALLMTAVMLFSLSGCSFRFSSFEDLLRPPKLTGKYQDLQKSFEKSAGSDYILRPPDNGDFQSAFITYDCDADGDEDAIVFYSDRKAPSTVKMLYFNYDDGKWNSGGSFEGSGSSVDLVMFPDIDNDGNPEILVGWSVLSDKINKTFTLYGTDNNKAVLIKAYPYTYVSCFDVNGDGVDDIFSLTVDSSVPELPTGYARVYNFSSQDKTLNILSETRTDGNISSYTSVNTENAEDFNYIYVEATKGDHDSITELIYWDDETNSLVSPFFDTETQTTKLTWRNMQISCFDIDGDGFLEIPTSVEMKGSFSSVTKPANSTNKDVNVKNDETESMYFIKWVKYRDGYARPVQYSVYNESGYLLNIHSSWVGRITAIKTDGQMDFYRWTTSTEEMGDLLFSLCTYDSTVESSRKMYSSYKKLKSSGNTNFAYSITDEGYDFGVNETNIEEGFMLTDFGGQK